ncbi:MAG: hypothetical protein ABSA46_10970 [Thermodesulfovibrionales bacterium]
MKGGEGFHKTIKEENAVVEDYKIRKGEVLFKVRRYELERRWRGILIDVRETLSGVHKGGLYGHTEYGFSRGERGVSGPWEIGGGGPE